MKATDIYSLFEAQQELFEVEMSPSNLKKLASQIDARVGMEFEMIVPDVQSEDYDDYEPEEDMDQDERADDIADIVRFFSSEDDYMGRVNDPSDIRDMEEELREKYYEWMSEQIDELWNTEEGKKFFASWVKDNVDPDEVAEKVGTPEDLFGNKHPSKSEYEEFVNAEWDEGFDSDNYQNAYDEFREDKQDGYDFDEQDFLRSIGIRDMSDVNNAIRGYIRWPFYEQNYGGEGQAIEDVADDFSDAIGKRVYSSTSYHGARRSEDAYSLEPDSSINAGSGEAGLEFISPPMPIDEMFQDLEEVKRWAKKRGAYTDKSTGLHINVSIPDYSLDKLDYVKLAVLLGDKYVLDQFGRIGTQWAKSALDIVKSRASDRPEDADRLLSKVKSGVEEIASKILHSGRTDKYTSINTKDNYVEFRSAGGDWLDANFDKIENTLLRFVVALDAACDPEKYKKEYYKGLYKVLKPKDPTSDMSLFAKYMSGQMTRNEYANSLESKRKERFRDQGIRILHKDDVEENDWEITYDDGKKSDTIYIANTDTVPNDEAAFNAAKKFKPQWFKPDTIEYITVKPFKFGEELNDLKLYRADYSHKYTSVVARDEEEAKENLKLMDPDYFNSYPETEITLTDENATKRQISQMIPWQENKIKIGKEWLTRPKIWLARARDFPSGSVRYYIAAVSRDEAINILNRLEGVDVENLGINYEVYVDQSYPDTDTYQAYEKAQEDVIRVREEERQRDSEAAEFNQAGEDETIDISNLKTYRVHSDRGYMYVVAENGGEAAEIAVKLDPEKFPSVESATAEDQSHLTSTSNPALIRSMYVSQKQKLAQLQPAQSDNINIPAELRPSSTRISDMRSWRVQNVDTGEARYFAGTDMQDAINRARQEYPAMFPRTDGLYATPAS